MSIVPLTSKNKAAKSILLPMYYNALEIIILTTSFESQRPNIIDYLIFCLCIRDMSIIKFAVNHKKHQILRAKIKDSESGNETHLSLKPFLKTQRSVRGATTLRLHARGKQ